VKWHAFGEKWKGVLRPSAHWLYGYLEGGGDKGIWTFACGMGEIAMGIVIGITVSHFLSTPALTAGSQEAELFFIQKTLEYHCGAL